MKSEEITAHSRATLVIVCGLPGSGKTTHATRIAGDLNAVRFCPDEWLDALSLSLYDERRRAEIEALQWKLAKTLLGRGVSVVIEWGTWAKAERDALRLGARELGVAVELHLLTAPIEILIERIQRRDIEVPAITREQMLEWAASFQEPSREEMGWFDRCRVLNFEGAS